MNLLTAFAELFFAARDSVRQWKTDIRQGSLSEGSWVLIAIWIATALLLALLLADGLL